MPQTWDEAAVDQPRLECQPYSDVMVRSPDHADRITRTDATSLENAQVSPRAFGGDKCSNQGRIVVAQPQLVARRTWFGHLQDGGADRPTLTNERSAEV